MGCLMGQDGTVGLAWLPLPWNIIEVMVNTAWFMMVHICPNINANVKNFIILVLFYGVCVYYIYMCVIMYSMIIWSLLFCLIPTIESRKTTDMFVALRRWPLRSAPIFFLDHRMGLFFCWRDGISNYAVLFHFQDIPSAAKSLSPWILEELWDVEDMVTSSWCITSGHGKTWQAGKSALPEDLRLSIRRAAVNSWGRFEDGGRWFWPSTVIFCMVCEQPLCL